MLAKSIFESLPRMGEHVFSSGRRGDRPISGFSGAKIELDEMVTNGADESEAPSRRDPWRIHDIRRTVGTNMARLGIPPFTVSRILNHAEGGVTQIYRRYSYLNEKRHALDAWGRKLEAITAGTPDNVVEIVEARV